MSGDMMIFPETWDEFERDYGFTDTEQIYTSGSRLIQSYRVKQWLEHIEKSKTYEVEVLDKALELFIQWAVECGFGYDNLGDPLEEYGFEIEDYGYTEGLKYIAIEEALTALGVRRECL